MRILFVSINFYPEPNFFMGLPFAKELVRRGHEVEVLTGFPNYPGGKLYDGYKIKWRQREVIDGIPVIRVPLYPSHDNSSVHRITTYSSFAFAASTIGAALVKKADVAYFSQGPVSEGLPAIILRFLRGIPFVYHIQDFEPDSLLSSGMFNSRLGLKVVDVWCNFVHKRAAKIVAISPGFKQKLVERGVPETKLEMIYNWCDDSQIFVGKPYPSIAKEIGMEGKFNIVFAGNMGKAQAIDKVIDAAALVQQNCPHVQFIFVGSGVNVESLKQKTVAMNLSNVRFIPRKPINEIGSILKLADILLVHLKDDPVYRITIPSKTQAYLAIGKPILIAPPGDAANLVLKAGAGMSCEAENPQSISEAIRRFTSMSTDELTQMGENSKRFYEQELAMSVATQKFEKIFESVAACKSK